MSKANFLGQEGFLLKANDKYVLTDPYLSDYVDRNCNTENVVWKRNYPSPVQPALLSFANYILCSHAHNDHADPDTLTAIYGMNKNVKIIVPVPIVKTIISNGIDKSSVIPARAFEPILLDGCVITPIPAAHENLNKDESGNYKELGYIVEFGSIKAFHSGDMCVYPELVNILLNYKPDIAFLPINGRDAFRLKNGIIGNMDYREAADLSNFCKFDLIIPMHFDLYPVNNCNVSYFVDYMQTNYPNIKYHIFRVGEGFYYRK